MKRAQQLRHKVWVDVTKRLCNDRGTYTNCKVDAHAHTYCDTRAIVPQLVSKELVESRSHNNPSSPKVSEF